MKPLEETKKGLECCQDARCEDCPYFGIRWCAQVKEDDALAHIKLLESQIPRWIPVEERLPEVEVLAANFQPGTYGYTDLIIGYVTATEQGCFAENNHEILHSVTHWMPMPEPPSKEDKK